VVVGTIVVIDLFWGEAACLEGGGGRRHGRQRICG